MALRHNLTSSKEIQDILLADVVLIIAFSLTIIGGIGAFQSSSSSAAIKQFIQFVPIAAIAVTLSFVLHELMHKFFAQRYGAIAEFRTSYSGLMITLATGAFGFLLGIPGATMIYTSSFTDKENGIVSVVGPLTNFAVFGAFLLIRVFANPLQGSFLYTLTSFTLEISILLAFFNMLPIFPLDGSKVLRWSKPIYIILMAIIFPLLLIFTPIGIYDLIIIIAIALFFSLFYRHIL